MLAEVDYFLRHDRGEMARFMRDVHSGRFTYAPPDLAALRRAMVIDGKFASLGLGLVDASIVALAEEVGVLRLATRDVRHFDAVRLAKGKCFDLVVRPGRR